MSRAHAYCLYLHMGKMMGNYFFHLQERAKILMAETFHGRAARGDAVGALDTPASTAPCGPSAPAAAIVITVPSCGRTPQVCGLRFPAFITLLGGRRAPGGGGLEAGMWSAPEDPDPPAPRTARIKRRGV